MSSRSRSITSSLSLSPIRIPKPVRKTDWNIRKAGWIELRPFQKRSPKLKNLRFPLFYSNYYTVGSEFDKDLILPETEHEIVPEVVISVRKSKVYIKNVSPTARKSKLLVKGKKVKPNEEIALKLPIVKCTACLQFGPSKYKYDLWMCKGPTLIMKQKLHVATICCVCRKFWQDPHPLPCGHVACQSCVDVLSNRAIDNATRLNLRQHFLDSQDSSQESSVVNFDTVLIKCPICSRKMAINEIAEMPTQPILTAIVDATLYTPIPVPGTCEECSNYRCATERIDYWQCNTCELTVCPMCALDNHRHHELRYGYSILLDNWMDYDKAILPATLTFEKVQNRVKVVNTKMNEIIDLLNAYQKVVKQLERSLDAVLKPAKDIYYNLKALSCYASSSKVEKERTQMLNLFISTVHSLRRPVTSALMHLDDEISPLHNRHSLQL